MLCPCPQTPVLALVGNDAGWTQIAREQVPMFGSNVACELEVGEPFNYKNQISNFF